MTVDSLAWALEATTTISMKARQTGVFLSVGMGYPDM
jgi:hypothetical protein